MYMYNNYIINYIYRYIIYSIPFILIRIYNNTYISLSIAIPESSTEAEGEQVAQLNNIYLCIYTYIDRYSLQIDI